MQSVQLTHPQHAFVPIKAVSPRRSPLCLPVRYPGTKGRSFSQAQRNPEQSCGQASQLLALAATIAPLLIPLQAFSEDQLSVADAGIPGAQIASIAAIAVPAVAFGAATLLQQAQQANEDRALRLKAIHKHNTFLSTQEEDDELADTAAATSSVTNTAMQSSGSPSQSNTSSSDEPDTAAPAMLDQPDRPEPRLPSLDEEAGSSLTPDADKQTNLPPQTAMLDRPERPEPESSHRDAADTQSSFTEQSGDVILGHDQFARPSSPANKEEAALRDAEYQAKIRNLKGTRVAAPAQQLTHQSQGVDTAAEYATKLAALHEESAARAQADLRKRQERYALLADLQAQAQMEASISEQLSQAPIPQADRFWTAMIAIVLRPMQWLMAMARKVMGMRHPDKQQSASVQYRQA